jgi:hypothetical protein
MALSPIVVSVPLYAVDIVVERAVDRWRNTGMYRFGDALSNVSTGLMQTAVGALFASTLARALNTTRDTMSPRAVDRGSALGRSSIGGANSSPRDAPAAVIDPRDALASPAPRAPSRASATTPTNSSVAVP